MSAYEKELTVAIEAVREAAGLCAAVQAQITPDVLEKKDRSPVTVADFGSQALVCRRLAEAFGGDPVIAEEDSAELRTAENAELLAQVAEHVARVQSGATADDACKWIDHGGAGEYSDRFWTLDPIDGTKGFLRKEQYAIALALIVGGELTVAAMACPNLDGGLIFSAVRGEGATTRLLSGASAATIRVSATDDGAAARFCESVESGHSSHDDSARVAELLGIKGESVRLDSQAKYGIVARGEADIYMRLPTRADYVEKIWDHAAGALTNREAGGTVTDIYGKPLEFTHGAGLSENKGVIATNGKLHDRVIAALQTAGVTA